MAKKKRIVVPKATKTSNGKYRIQLRLNKKSVYVYGDTEQECINNAALKKSEYRAGVNQLTDNDKTPTLRAAIDAYIEKRSDTLSPSTITGYKRIRDGRFKPYMDTPIGKLTDWTAICNNERKTRANVAKNKKDKPVKPISPKTIKNAYFFIRSVYKENGIILPEVKFATQEKNTRKWLEPDEIKQLVSSVAGKNEQIPVLLALHSLRRSELLALEWKNIDLERERITIKGAVVKDYDNNFIKKDANKNQSSQREIPIMIPALLKALKDVPAEDRNGPVITINGNSILYEVKKACRDAGVSEVGTHGLRHSFASLAYHLGMSELETMQLGGWSDYKTMREIYTHLAEKDRLKAENKMKAFFSE